MEPTERWGADLWRLFQIFNFSMASQLPDIWTAVAPLKKDWARAAMEAACRSPADSLRLRPSRIPQTVAVMVMALTLHTEDPDRVGDALNIILFPNLSPSAGSEAALLTRKWDAILGAAL